ncbi:hypothetical protein EEJ42_47095 [Streptomyces botrytidirepellens]|uniref:ScoMcrA-like SRA domain-containing protein n=2 Tax=Streptomyces botrytidirepellens TaxID=2486417 RepID=A0A3M8SII6_9ACTN|nr:hypothetical protein EEJ42_47095 [Streptomyces botrytidirepellens]
MADRQQLHDVFGGRRTGRVCKSGRTPEILLFSDCGDGVGGYDGWTGDHYLFAGEGLNDVSQALEGQGNASILKHHTTNRTLRLFLASPGQGPRYLGRYSLDETTPWIPAQAPPLVGEGPTRNLVIFRLIPMDGPPDGVPHVDTQPRPQAWEANLDPAHGALSTPQDPAGHPPDTLLAHTRRLADVAAWMRNEHRARSAGTPSANTEQQSTARPVRPPQNDNPQHHPGQQGPAPHISKGR